MAIQLNIKHIDGLRLRQQIAQKVERASDAGVVSGTEWKFDPAGVSRDLDPRNRDGNGAPIQLPSYTAYIAHGLRNLVIERKGAPTNIEFRNPSLRNSIKFQGQELKATGRKDKDGVAIKEWRNYGTALYLPPNSPCGAHVGDGIRAILEEQPT